MPDLYCCNHLVSRMVIEVLPLLDLQVLKLAVWRKQFCRPV